MVRFFLMITLGLATLAPASPASGKQTASVDQKVPDGLRIPAVLDTGLSSHKSKVGDPVRLEVVADVHDRTGKVVLPRHARLTGRVTYVLQYERNKEPAVLSFVVDHAEWKGHSALLDAPVFGTDVGSTDARQGEMVENIQAATLRHTDSLNLVNNVQTYDFRHYGNAPQALHDDTLHSVIMQLTLVTDPAIRTAFVKRNGDLELPSEYLVVLLNGMKVVQ